jgi:uncharacterized membrane protein (DUF4010 family)
LADVDAITLAAAREATGGITANELAALAIAIAVISNTILKGTMAVVAGGRRFGLPVVAVFTAAIAIGGGAAVLTAYL